MKVLQRYGYRDMERDDAILEYLQDRMSRDDRDRFDADMAQDASLAAEVEVMRSVRTALGSGPIHEDKDAVWARLSRSIDQVPEPANVNRSPWGALSRYAAVAVVAVSAWQVAIVPRMVSAPETFRPVSELTADIALQVKFVDTATFTQIAELIYILNGTITDGPGALGILLLSFSDSDMRAQAIDALERSDLVEFVQAR